MWRIPFPDSGWRAYAWLGIVFVLYLRTLSFELTFLDDNFLLRDKLSYLSDLSNIPAAFAQGSWLGRGSDVYYRPLVIVSMMLDAAVGRGSLAVFHLTNTMFHFLSSCMVFVVLRKLGRPERALPLALLYAVHPALAQSVAWMPSRSDSLLAVFLLASFAFFLDFLAERRWRPGLLHLLFFALALLSKELAIVLPAVCAAYVLLRAPRRPPARQAVGLALGWVVLLAAWYVVRLVVLEDAGAYTLSGTVHSVYTNLPALLLYLGKCVVPGGLSTYPILRDSTPAYGLAALLLLGVGLLLSKRWEPRALLMGGAWFILFLLPSLVYPESHITPVFFEYRLQLPLVGLLLILGEMDAYERIPERGRPLAFGVLLLAFFAAAWANAGNYRDGLAFWTSAVDRSPNSAFAHRQLGVIHYFGGRFDAAAEEYGNALRLNQREPMVHNNLGVIHKRAGRMREAEKEFLAEISLNPGFDGSYFNLGLISYARGDGDRAAALWRKTVELNPDHSESHKNLAIYYRLKGGLAASLRHCREARKLGARIDARLCPAP
ncbi:tetratricopeptide repeat protein [Elusimicrobiota bacterium]